MNAFDEADGLLRSGQVSPGDLDRLKAGIIELLTEENARNNVSDAEMAKRAAAASCGNGTDNCGGDEGDGGESDYYARLIDTVASFDDESAIPALAGAMTWGSASTNALSKFGNKALGPVLDQLKSKNSSLRASALDMAIVLLRSQNNSQSRTRISELIRTSLVDPSSVVRSDAIRSVACLDNRRDYVPMLEDIAKHDPLRFAGQKADDGGDGDDFYPVRFDARRALRSIKNNEPCEQ